ncbi:hypothetical protein L484_014622 [Morus notabilis]|uniref:Uncharacterized protein n=1 Tax=Morus notabilis TaxID=981085 RepID=W9RLT1_9ROSA|nr:hypothetical protein L484_014622 [Morus notabilis]
MPNHQAMSRSFSNEQSLQTYACSWPWTRTFSDNPRITSLTQKHSALTRFSVRLYSREAGESSEKPEPTMEKEDEKEKGAFYVVRKGDVVGIYRSLDDRQAQVGSSMWDPPVSVFKGHRFPKETEEYLISRGLKDAIFTIRAKDMKDGLFGLLVQCPLQVEKVPTSLRGVISSKATSEKRSQLVEGLENVESLATAARWTEDGWLRQRRNDGGAVAAR